jgi:hypothetical protein
MKKDRLSTTLENVHRWLKPVCGILKLVCRILTAFGIISAIIGTVIIKYTYHTSQSTFRQLTSLIIRNLEVFMFVFSALLLSLVGVFLLPFFTPYFVMRETGDILPNLFGMPVRSTFFNFLLRSGPCGMPRSEVNLLLQAVDAAAYLGKVG